MTKPCAESKLTASGSPGARERKRINMQPFHCAKKAKITEGG